MHLRPQRFPAKKFLVGVADNPKSPPQGSRKNGGQNRRKSGHSARLLYLRFASTADAIGVFADKICEGCSCFNSP